MGCQIKAGAYEINTNEAAQCVLTMVNCDPATGTVEPQLVDAANASQPFTAEEFRKMYPRHADCSDKDFETARAFIVLIAGTGNTISVTQ